MAKPPTFLSQFVSLGFFLWFLSLIAGSFPFPSTWSHSSQLRVFLELLGCPFVIASENSTIDHARASMLLGCWCAAGFSLEVRNALPEGAAWWLNEAANSWWL